MRTRLDTRGGPRPRRWPGRAAGLLLCLGLGVGAADAATIWAPMWDQRSQVMDWEVLGSSPSVTFSSDFIDSGFFSVKDKDGNLIANSSFGSGLRQVTISATPGERYTMTVNISGIHYRNHWDGVEWVRIGSGDQLPSPGTDLGFQSDAELGFDHRWGTLPAQYAHTTWYYNVSPSELLSVSVEHVTGHTPGAKKFEWIAPDGTATVADADGMPGSGFAHWQARAGSRFNAVNTASQYWDEYVAPAPGTDPTGEWWGFKLYADSGLQNLPYSWHYILDRTDPGTDQYHYLLPGSIKDPTKTPEPGVLALVLLPLGALAIARRRASA